MERDEKKTSLCGNDMEIRAGLKIMELPQCYKMFVDMNISFSKDWFAEKQEKYSNLHQNPKVSLW